MPADDDPIVEGSSPDEQGVAPSRDLRSLLEVEELDTDLFRAANVSDDERSEGLYGGTVAAQSLMAAAATVPDGRAPHSLHGAFLRPGRSQHPTILRVERDRDGRSFSARRVTALQGGKAIFTMACSFHLDEPGGDHQELAFPTDVGPPDAAAERDDPTRRHHHLMLDLRDVPHEGPTELFPRRVWGRSRVPLPDDPVLQACALTYFSDLYTALGTLAPDAMIGPSLDHALWFHRRVPMDDWVLMDLWPRSVHGARGLYAGALYDRHGTLAATLHQEMLVRDAPPEGDPRQRAWRERGGALTARYTTPSARSSATSSGS